MKVIERGAGGLPAFLTGFSKDQDVGPKSEPIELTSPPPLPPAAVVVQPGVFPASKEDDPVAVAVMQALSGELPAAPVTPTAAVAMPSGVNAIQAAVAAAAAKPEVFNAFPALPGQQLTTR